MIKQLKRLLRSGNFCQLIMDTDQLLQGIIVDIDGECFNIIQSESLACPRAEDEDEEKKEIETKEEDGFTSFFFGKPKTQQEVNEEERIIVESSHMIESILSIKFDVAHEISATQLEVLQSRRDSYLPASQKKPAVKKRNTTRETKRNTNKSSRPVDKSQVRE